MIKSIKILHNFFLFMGGVFGDGVKREGGTDDLEARSRAAGISVSCVRTVHARLSVPDVHCPFYFLWNLMVLLVNVRPAQTGVREQPDTGYRKSRPPCSALPNLAMTGELLLSNLAVTGRGLAAFKFGCGWEESATFQIWLRQGGDCCVNWFVGSCGSG